jgi:NitT/TauT family transport system permease protein
VAIDVKQKNRIGIKQFLIRYSAIIIFFVIWEVFPRIGLTNAQFIPPLSKVLSSIYGLALSGELFIHAGYSLRRILSGFLLASVISIPLGFLLGGFFRTFEESVDRLFQVLAQINPFSVFPIFILFFGIGETTKIAIIFWVCLWPTLFSTINGVKNIDPLLLKAAHVMGVSKATMFWKVILPGASSSIFSGIRLGMGSACLMLIAAEMIGASAGLGWLVLNSQINYQITRLFAAAVTIAVLGILLTNIIILLEKKLTKGKADTPAI